MAVGDAGLPGPLLSEAAVAPLVEEIAEAIASTAPRLYGVGPLPVGNAGIALFYGTLARVTGDAKAAALAEKRLAEAMAEVAARPMPCALHDGFLGVAWVRTHLLGSNEPDDGIERALAASLRTGWDGDYGLVHGLVGVGVYALERRLAGSRSPLLGLVVDRLAEGSERRGPGRAWRIDRRRLTPESRKRHPRGLVDLGLAHGVPGALVVLAGAAAAGVARARPLLDYAVAFLLAQRLPDGCVARFAVADSLREPARAAWCYGDAGIALALLLAARAVGERQWEREAVAIGRVAARRPPSTSGVKDAALCHGAAGLAHLFHRLYRATGERIFRDAALVWFRETLAMRRAGVGVAGYRAFTDRWVDDAGFLTGAAGIGLALLGASTRTEPSWDRVLLCSLASPGLL